MSPGCFAAGYPRTQDPRKESCCNREKTDGNQLKIQGTDGCIWSLKLSCGTPIGALTEPGMVSAFTQAEA
jgi:hypothetical protein